MGWWKLTDHNVVPSHKNGNKSPKMFVFKTVWEEITEALWGR